MTRRIVIGTVIVAIAMAATGVVAFAYVDRAVRTEAQNELFRQAEATGALIEAELADLDLAPRARIETQLRKVRIETARVLERARVVGGHEIVEAAFVVRGRSFPLSTTQELISLLPPALAERDVVTVDVDGTEMFATVQRIPMAKGEVVVAIGRTAPLLPALQGEGAGDLHAAHATEGKKNRLLDPRVGVSECRHQSGKRLFLSRSPQENGGPTSYERIRVAKRSRDPGKRFFPQREKGLQKNSRRLGFRFLPQGPPDHGQVLFLSHRGKRPRRFGPHKRRFLLEKRSKSPTGLLILSQAQAPRGGGLHAVTSVEEQPAERLRIQFTTHRFDKSSSLQKGSSFHRTFEFGHPDEVVLSRKFGKDEKSRLAH